MPRAENQALYRTYEALARETPDVSFVGRLATYRYYNMDQVVGQALATYRRLRQGAGRDESARIIAPGGLERSDGGGRDERRDGPTRAPDDRRPVTATRRGPRPTTVR